MKLRQKLIIFAYPLLHKCMQWLGNTKSMQSNIMATDSFYQLQAELNNGSVLPFSSLKGKKVLIVNTASDCGYTPQYKGLQQLHEKFGEALTVIGFPSNEFGEQEKGNDAEIEQFCSVNYGVSFPMAKKSSVKKSAEQNQVFQWLTNEDKNGWNSHAPNWNFCKYLIDENGNLTHFFPSAVDPMDKELLDKLSHS